MPASDIVVKGAREHNLRDVSLVLPRNKLICLTGVSGSGKSSLAFDTLYAEGQRRYVESLSSFARQFLGQMPKPDVDLIAGLSPSISISQKSTGNNPRSTVGTITEIYDYLRVLLARVSQGHCPECGRPITAQTREQIIEQIMGLPTGTKYSVLAPVIRGQKGEYRDLFEDLLKQGYIRARVDGEVVSLSDDLQLDRQMRHDIEVVIDRLSAKPSIRPRLAEAIDLAIKVGKGNLIVAVEGEQHRADKREKGGGRKRRKKGHPGDTLFSTAFACIPCGKSFEPPSPQLFSFNSPQGMCLECDGLGQLYTFDPELLIPDGTLSFKAGAVRTVGPWKELGRWRRHIFQGVADTMERKLDLEPGTLLETPWDELDEELQDILLWGTGEEHITFTWRSGSSPQKYGGTYEGIIPELLSKYASTQSKMQQRALEKYMSTVRCPECDGQRLNAQARHARITSASELFADNASLTLPEVCGLPVNAAADFFAGLQLSDTQQIIAAEAIKEIRGRLGFLMNVGLDYLTLDRTAPTLSGGESQRIRLAGQIGCGLIGVLYILDEPSIGLHPRDNDRLLATLCQLRDMGNTVLVVEHDEDTMRTADHIVDFGPGPGVRGGELVAEGSADSVMQAKRSVTGAFLAGKRAIGIPQRRRLGDTADLSGSENGVGGTAGSSGSENGSSTAQQAGSGAPELRIVGARQNNLKNIDVAIPLGGFICVTGVSGSGKSSLVNDILVEALRRDLNGGVAEPGEHERLEGLDHLDKMIAIDQSPIGRTPRSNPGTYIKVFDDIRRLFTQLPDAKRRGYKPGRFSFNVQGGRCEACQGNGSNKLEMDFLADIWVTCPVCEGHRFNRETLGVRFKGKSIADVLEMDVQEALALFENQPKIAHKLQTLHDVGLDYLKIGQPSPTLSGGEAQRIKLARELVKKSTGRTIYFLDEPTTGLHFADIEMLLKVLHGFADAGNTVVVVEHNLDVVKTADWIIDLGPEGGEAGGRVVVAGTPEEVAEHPKSHTGKALRGVLSRGKSASAGSTKTGGRTSSKQLAGSKNGKLTTKIKVQGAQQHNLKHVDVDVPRDAMSVFCGPSGSGKTSLAMDTIYAEGQRRYVESLSAYARQFVGQMQKPKLEHIEGLSPAIAIEQKNLGHTPRSTVGTVTEIYDYFRILYARLGQMHCPDCSVPVGTQSADEVIDKVLAEPEGTKLYLMAPVDIEVGRRYESLWDELRTAGYNRIRVNGTTHPLDEPPEIDRRRKHRVEVVVDRVVVRAKERSRIAESVENALALGRGVLHVAYASDAPETRWPVTAHSQHLACDSCGRSFEPLTPHSFSFNSYLGWCGECEGLGTQIGANPAALIRDGKLTLAEGALALWPDLSRPLAEKMLAVLAEETGLPLDVPLDQMSARQKRIVMHGTEERWFDVTGEPPALAGGGALAPSASTPRASTSTRKKKRIQGANAPRSAFRFQFKGLYPALEEASRLSPSFRTRLEHLVDEVDCTACGGSRLRDDAAAVQWRGKALDEIGRMPLGELRDYFQKLRFNKTEKRIAGELVREIKSRLQFLCDVGLEYLTLARSAPTLSAGEAQRIRLASQLGSGLCGVLYVLDEPTIGLHPRDNNRLLGALHKLRDLGNTLLVVEHDREVIEGSDHVFDFGPAAGKQGGQIVAMGQPEQLLKRRKSVTGPYLSGKKAIAVPTNRRVQRGNDRPLLEVVGARQNNLRNVNVTVPLGTLTAVTGPSGSGKSSLVEDVLYAALARRLHRANIVPGIHDAIRGVEHVNKVIRVDQKPLGNSPASNPATYTGVFNLIRELFAQLPESKLRGFTQRRFSFNVPGGRCDDCEGEGQICIEMHFLPDVWVECETCRGKRYNPETLAVKYHGNSIADVLEMTCGEALRLFANIPKIRRTLQTLCDVGLDYLQLGQPAPTLSGGEAQRVKLAAELSRPDTGQTLYLLDEPTTGLHFDDLAKLLDVLHRLVDLGNTVVVIEHNLDVIKQADWVIDMGPEAGDSGGEVVACGTPEEIAKRSLPNAKSTKRKRSRKSKPVSHTAQYLAPVLAAGPHEERKIHDFAAEIERREGDLDIDDVGRNTQMPWQVDGRQWHCHDRVGRKGEACRWDGRILERVVDRIHELGEFSDTNWDSRTVVEIAAEKKSDGWFFHAITGEAWLLKMKFRVAKNTFKRDELQRRIPLPTLNEMDDLPVYGNEPRVKCKNLRGAWQEVEIRAHALEEIDTDEFWKFLEQAVAGFFKHTRRAQQKPEDIMPWKVLGQKWHFSRKGFPPGKRIKWDTEVLEELFELLSSAAPDGQFLWNNQVLVHLYANGHQDPWATVVTKRTDAVELRLNGPKGQFALGRISEMGRSRELDTSGEKRDTIKLRFRNPDDLHKGGLSEFLKEHVERL